MRTLIFCLIATFFVVIKTQAQNDTIYYQNFNKTPNTINRTPPLLVDTALLIYDQDNLPDGRGRAQNWFRSSAFTRKDSTAGSVFASSSWLESGLNGNRNYLILPRFWVVDNQTTLNWKSAPYQAPRYMDGYAVVVSISGSNGAADFTDTIFRAAQMIPNANGSIGTGKNPANYRFSGGYIHANNFTDTLYFKNRASTASDTTVYDCLLEPHSINLSAYNGRQISVAFVHNSDNDNMISIDDIFVKGQRVSTSIQGLSQGFDIKTYPNPTRNDLNIDYVLQKNTPVLYSIYDLNGKLVWQQNGGIQLNGAHFQKIDVSAMPAGNYVFKLLAENIGVFTQKITLTK